MKTLRCLMHASERYDDGDVNRDFFSLCIDDMDPADLGRFRDFFSVRGAEEQYLMQLQ